jgi:hypothetical protein
MAEIALGIGQIGLEPDRVAVRGDRIGQVVTAGIGNRDEPKDRRLDQNVSEAWISWSRNVVVGGVAVTLVRSHTLRAQGRRAERAAGACCRADRGPSGCAAGRAEVAGKTRVAMLMTAT